MKTTCAFYHRTWHCWFGFPPILLCRLELPEVPIAGDLIAIHDRIYKIKDRTYIYPQFTWMLTITSV